MDDLIPLADLKAYMEQTKPMDGPRITRARFTGIPKKVNYVRSGRTLTSGTVRQKVQRAARLERDGFSPLTEHIAEKDFLGGSNLDPRGPTHHLPGTEAKMDVMSDRAKRKVSVFHPLDNTGVDGD